MKILTLLLVSLHGFCLAAKPERIEIYPPAVELDGAAAKQRLVVQAVYADGRSEEVLARAKTTFSKKIVSLKDGLLRPAGDGETTLKISYKGTSANVPVVVRASGKKARVSFRNDVEPAFMRAGCNTGACHGSARGQDGFHLSLFGYDPAGDYFRLTRQLFGRRLNVAVPEKSLLLEKATGVVTHSGGELMTTDSELYATLREWIATGAPDDPEGTPEVTGIELLPKKMVFQEGSGGIENTHQMVVMADYSDGSRRDITHLALYLTNNERTATIDEDGRVEAGGSGAAYVFARFDRYTVGAEAIVLPSEQVVWPNPKPVNYIDEAVFEKLKKLQIAPSDVCSDEEFLRRVTLDLVGLPPSSEDYDAFVEDRSPDKRTVLVDALLERPEFVDLWAMKWGEVLQITTGRNQVNSGRSPKSVFAYYKWVRGQVAAGRPANEMVADLVRGSGSNLHTPQANFYTSGDRIDTNKRAEDFAQQFLGMRIQCAQCHNHPFDRWTMDDYYGFTSFFEGVAMKNGADPREYYIRYDVKKQSSQHPVGKRAMKPKFLGGELPETEDADPRDALADWLTAPDNDMFAQNLANRVWAHFFGRGIVEPVDDVRISNPPSNRELLEGLADALVGHGFDMKALVRDICLSRTYQLSSSANGSNALDDTQFSHSRVRRLQAEVLADTVNAVTESVPQFSGYPRGLRAVQAYQGARNDYFLKTFGASPRETVCACDVNMEPTLSQALLLINATTMQSKIRSAPFMRTMLKEKASPEEIVDRLYVQCLTRKPTAVEMKQMLDLIGDDTRDAAAYEDVFWALLNSTEFMFNH